MTGRQRAAALPVLLALVATGCTSGHPAAGRAASSNPAVALPSAAPTVTSPNPLRIVSPPPASPSETPSKTPSLTPTSSATHSSATHTAATHTQAAVVRAVFVASATTVTAAQLGKSWHAGCPVGPAQLRNLTMTYWGFDAKPHMGTLVVNASVVPAVTRVFRTLFADHFPIRTMIPVSEFGASDTASMAADNTSSFNCRYAVANGPPQWSAHAYGEAIDVNTVENPYVFNGQVLPSPQAAAYKARTPYRPGMAVRGGQLVGAFAAVGWFWGGRWSAPDYQHFSSTGG